MERFGFDEIDGGSYRRKEADQDEDNYRGELHAGQPAYILDIDKRKVNLRLYSDRKFLQRSVVLPA